MCALKAAKARPVAKAGLLDWKSVKAKGTKALLKKNIMRRHLQSTQLPSQTLDSHVLDGCEQHIASTPDSGRLYEPTMCARYAILSCKKASTKLKAATRAKSMTRRRDRRGLNCRPLASSVVPRGTSHGARFARSILTESPLTTGSSRALYVPKVHSA